MRWLIAALEVRTNATMKLTSADGDYRLHIRDGVLVALEVPFDDDDWAQQDLLRATSIFALADDTHVDVGLAEEFSEADRVRVPPLQLITRGLRAYAGNVEPLSLVKPLREAKLRLRADAPVGQLGLLRFELSVVDAVRHVSRTFGELAAERFVHPRGLCATLFILHELRFFEGADAPPVGIGHDTAPPSVRRDTRRPKVAISADVPSVSQLEARLRGMAQESFFEMLGVEPSASNEDIRAALARQLYQYHPDRLPPTHRRVATLISARLSGAASNLCDPQLRARHLDELGLRCAVPAVRPERLDEVLRDAEHLVAIRHHREAEALLLQALESCPGEPSLTSLLAWAQAESMGDGDGTRTDRYNRVLRTMRAVVNAHPTHARARERFARVLMKSGRVDASVRQFRILLSIEPDNVGAARELRLHELRLRQRATRQLAMTSTLKPVRARPVDPAARFTKASSRCSITLPLG